MLALFIYKKKDKKMKMNKEGKMVVNTINNKLQVMLSSMQLQHMHGQNSETIINDVSSNIEDLKYFIYKVTNIDEKELKKMCR